MGFFSQSCINKEVKEIHREYKYNNINEIIDKRAIEIRDQIAKSIFPLKEINFIGSFAIKEKTISIINDYFPEKSILFKCLNSETLLLEIPIEDMINFYYYEAYELIDYANNENEKNNTFVTKELGGDGYAYASNDRIRQDIINTVEVLKNMIKASLIEMITTTSSFSPATTYEIENLKYYTRLRELERVVDKEKDIFHSIGKEMEIFYRFDYLDKVITFKAFKIFKDNDLKLFKKAITENYLYLLTKIPTRETYFIAKLFNGALIQYTDYDMLEKVKDKFSKYIFKKEHENSYKHLRVMESVIALNGLAED